MPSPLQNYPEFSSQKPAARRLPGALLLALGLAVALPLASCTKEAAAGATAPQMPAPEVSVQAVEARQIADIGRFTGRLAAVDHVELRPRVSGNLEAVHFQAGQLVEQGAKLFSIDARPYMAARDSAQAALREAQVRVDNARIEWQRAQKLAESKAVSAEELEGRRASLAEAEAMVASRQAALDLALLDLSFTTISAPFTGRIGRALVTPGNLVGGAQGAGTHLATLVSIDPLHVYADLDEASFLSFEAARAAGQLPVDEHGHVKLSVELIEGAGGTLAASLESLDNQVEAGTGTLLLRALLPNPDGRLVPGLFARVYVPLTAPASRVMVPERAIGTDQSQKFVYVVGAGNTAERRNIEIGPSINGERAVLSGVQAGDRVVVNGLQRIFFPGQPIQPVEAAEAATAAAPGGAGGH
jgi:RND family efflux transporter MFP subunit